MKEKNKRTKILQILAVVASVLLYLMIWIISETEISNLNEYKTEMRSSTEEKVVENNVEEKENNAEEESAKLIEGVKSRNLVFKNLRSAGVGLFYGVMILFLFAMFMILSLYVVGKIGKIIVFISNKSEDNKQSNGTQKNNLPVEDKKEIHSALSMLIACGIISLFFFLPFILGDQSNREMGEIWENGVKSIGNVFPLSEENTESDDTKVSSAVEITNIDADYEARKTQTDFSDDLMEYTMLYMVFIGVGIVTFQILYVVIRKKLQKEDEKDIIDEYSSPIAFLTIGVAILLMLRDGKLSSTDHIETIGELLKSYCTIIFSFTITILTLEIIKQLMNTKVKLIRREAEHLFIYLIGHSTLLLFEMLSFLYSAICGAIGRDPIALENNSENSFRNKIIESMENGLNKMEKGNIKILKGNKRKRAFDAFEETITKK